MKRSPLLFWAVALVLGACSSPVDEGPEAPGLMAPAFDAAGACLNWRWIGISPGVGCPTPTGSADSWGTQPLFAIDPTGRSSPLDAFCLYESGGQGNTTDIPALVTAGELERADRDCAAVAGSADPGFAEHLAPGFEQHFFAQTGRTEIPAGTQGVRLAFLDTSRTKEDGKPGLEVSRHGFTMTHLARKLLCDPENPEACAARITTRLALPLLELGPSAAATRIGDRGGFFGTLAQLANAVRAETDRWQKAGTAERLILNLSIAWDPQRFGGLEENVHDMPAPIQAVYRALEDATCRGALVVAAAGNRSGGPDAGSGARLPAAWETRRAPDAAACAHLPGLDPALFAPPDAVDPLVYAVGGVDSSGSPLVNVRPGAIPRLAAYGDHAVTWAGLQKRWTGIYTGSSVATTVVSAAAAAVWHHRGDLRREELMELLYLSGDALDRDAVLYPAEQGDPPEVHRISLCQALRQACLGEACEAVPQDLVPHCDPWSQQAPFLSVAVDAFLSEASATKLDASVLDAVADAVEPCAAAFHVYDSQQEPTTFCPADEYYGIWDRPWTGPQPYDIPCPSCPVKEDPEGLMNLNTCGDVAVPYTLAIEISPTYAGGNLTAATLEIGDTSYSLPEVAENGLQPGDLLEVDCIEGSAIKEGAPVSLSFMASAHGAVANPVIVVD